MRWEISLAPPFIFNKAFLGSVKSWKLFKLFPLLQGLLFMNKIFIFPVSRSPTMFEGRFFSEPSRWEKIWHENKAKGISTLQQRCYKDVCARITFLLPRCCVVFYLSVYLLQHNSFFMLCSEKPTTWRKSFHSRSNQESTSQKGFCFCRKKKSVVCDVSFYF